jgi:zinc transporter 1/2/3
LPSGACFGRPPADLTPSRSFGTDYLQKRGMIADHQPSSGEGNHTAHEHPISTGGHIPSFPLAEKSSLKSSDDSLEDPTGAALGASAQILGVAILGKRLDCSSNALTNVRIEFGVIFHSVIIGLTLATTNEFTVLFIVVGF